MHLTSATVDSLQCLRKELPELAEILKMDISADLQPWTHALDVKLLPRLQPDFPLVVAICGGGSAGKSTLFNSLIGSPASPVGGRAGLNRRVLAALQESFVGRKALMDSLAQVFGTELQPCQSISQISTPGPPLFTLADRGSPQVVLLDTPDIDTGARGAYANRDLARQSLECADAFIYIFTNATYNNRDNTDFISRLLTGLGTRPCYLVYRVYPSFSDREVREHALTAAANIYGENHAEHILDIFRADEENRVAAGGQPMRLRSVLRGAGDLSGALRALEPRKLRGQVMRSILADAAGQARSMHAQAGRSQAWLSDYIEALEAAQRTAVQQALSHFPLDRVLRRFGEIWVASDPLHIKVMRRTGQVVEWPLKLALAAAGLARGSSKALPVPQKDPAELLVFDLLQAANVLYQTTMAESLQNAEQSLQAHPVVRATQERLRSKDWQATLTYIQDQKEKLLSWSGQLQKELLELARSMRQRMGVFDQIRQTFAALLNVIPATAAITYILHTGDPVGAAGISVKLTGLLGLHDLYALIAIPATAGMKKADRGQLEIMLAPLARTWLSHKLQAVEALFEEQITAEVLSDARSAHVRVAELLERIDSRLAALQKESPP